MGTHQPRHQDGYTVYRLRQECFQGERLFRPDGAFNPMVARQLERWRQVFGVIIFAYCIVESEMELLVQCPDKNRAQFTCNLYREISRRTNRLRDREDTVFPRPYQPEALLDDASILAAYAEVVCLPVERGLVTHPERWPGLVSLPPHPDDADKQRWRERVCEDPDDPIVAVGTELPPGLEGLEEDEAYRRLWQAIEARRVAVRAAQATRAARVPSRRQLLARSPLSKAPRHRRKLAMCRSHDPQRAERWYARYKRRVLVHKAATRSYKQGNALPPYWPRGMHPPGWHDVAEAQGPAVEVA